MNKTRKRVIIGITCVVIALPAYFADKIPFFLYENELIHTTIQEFFSLQHIVRLAPLMIITGISAVIIIILAILRDRIKDKGNKEGRRAEKRTEKKKSGSIRQNRPAFVKARWIIMISFALVIMFGGILTGIFVHEVSIPVFSCPTNMDQLIESSCYFLSHLPFLFEEYSAGGVILFFITTIVSCILLGRVICGFLCPMGLIQDIMHVIRQKTKTEGIVMNESGYRRLKPVKWLLVFLMFGLVFVGVNFCSFCPALTVSPVLAGMQVSIYLSGFVMIVVLVGSFFKRRFWCNICPLGYIIGLAHRISPFRIKKDTQSCTGCGACYEACPAGIKTVYTEREKADVTDINCIMCGECVRNCPEDNALSMTFAGKRLFTSSRMQFMSVYKRKDGNEQNGERNSVNKG